MSPAVDLCYGVALLRGGGAPAGPSGRAAVSLGGRGPGPAALAPRPALSGAGGWPAAAWRPNGGIAAWPLRRRAASPLSAWGSGLARAPSGGRPPAAARGRCDTRAAAAATEATESSGPDAAPDTGGAAPPASAVLPTRVLGRVMTAQANYVRVRVADPSASPLAPAAGAAGVAAAPAALPGRELLCVVRALLKKTRQRVLVGDWVEVGGVDWADGRGMVHSVRPRQSELEDPAVANVSQVLLLFACANPPLEPAQLSRFLVAAEASGAAVCLALNKSDLVSAAEREAWAARLRAWGYEPHFTATVPRTLGLGPVEARLRGHTTVVVGPSGAGKSSVINALRAGAGAGAGAGAAAPSADASAGRDAGAGAAASGGRAARGGGTTGSPPLTLQAVGDVSERSRRGKHTTRNVTLLPLPPLRTVGPAAAAAAEAGAHDDADDLEARGLLADTPGFNQPHLEKLTIQMLPGCFPEIRRRLADAGPCQFAGCTHRDEPGCVVRPEAAPEPVAEADAGQRSADAAAAASADGQPSASSAPAAATAFAAAPAAPAGFRWERYPLYRELWAEVDAREVAVRGQGRTGRHDVGMRYKTGAAGGTQAEPKLNAAKHRRESRRRARQSIGDDDDDDDDGEEEEEDEAGREEQTKD